MYDKRSMFEAMEVGVALDLFVKSKEGDFLFRRAKREILAGMYELKDCDPTDVKAIMAAQSRVRVAENFTRWIEDGIADGMQAHRNIQEHSEDDGFSIEGQEEGYGEYDQDGQFQQ